MREAWRRNVRCRCAFRRPTGARRRDGGRRRSGSRARSCRPAPTSSTSRPGQTSLEARPCTAACTRRRFSDQVRQRGSHPDDRGREHHRRRPGERDIAAGRADLCALARPQPQLDPFWTLHAAAALGYTAQHWPRQYLHRPKPARTQPPPEGRRRPERSKQRLRPGFRCIRGILVNFAGMTDILDVMPV